MFGGCDGGMNPSKMRKMMKQMGIDVEQLDVEEAVIRTTDGEELVFESPDVTQMDARGQQTYQVVGEPEVREADDDAGSESDADEEIPSADVEIVAERTGASEDEAREALEAGGGDLATAVSRLE